MNQRNGKRTGARAGAVALLLAGGMLLTACGGSGSSDGSSTADKRSGAHPPQGATGGGQPAPDAVAPVTASMVLNVRCV